jgi:diguanylate cyclase (GGDEF)-like protein
MPSHTSRPQPENGLLAKHTERDAIDQLCAFARDTFRVALTGVAVGTEESLSFPNRSVAGSGAGSQLSALCVAAMRSREVLTFESPSGAPESEAQSGAPGPNFFAAAAMRGRRDESVGALYLLDPVFRVLGAAGRRQLQELADIAGDMLTRDASLSLLRRREALLEQASRLARVGSWEVDLVTGARSWSDEMYDIYGAPPAGGPLSTEEILDYFVNAADRTWLSQLLKLTPEARLSREVREIEIVSKSGDRRWLRSIYAFDADSGGNARVYGCNQDVTELHESRRQIERLAFQDPLTGLPNRAFFNRQFQDELDSALLKNTKVGLILLDLDHFKDVNDTLGHDAGDALLGSVAERLLRAYRRSDTIARLGGDEFAVILPDVKDLADLERPTAKLMDLLRQPVEHGGATFAISASVGAAMYPADDLYAKELLKNADIALYAAKAAGRNRFEIYAPAMRAAVEQRAEILREVRRGISAGEFILYYQPVMKIIPESVVGFEALMRWAHPERGVLTPDAFMQAFEDPELSPLLGDLCLETALKQMRAWLDEGIEFGRVAINISAEQFRRPDLADKIVSSLLLWNVPADRLTVEVTENVYMGWGKDLVGTTVQRLHDAGVLIALDDFGTGYASLVNLRQFPVDRLKVDKSFVQNKDDRAIVQAVITLGSSLGMKVIAEGVEELDQLAFLAESGCDQVQGYHYSRPLPPAAVPAFLDCFRS